jgi:hypothetical protein
VNNNLPVINFVAKRDFLDFAIARSEHEHAELSDSWKLLDTKAQATTATAGVFVAASFAFIRNSQLQLDYLERISLALTVLTLVVAIIEAIRSMRIRLVDMPPTGAETLEEIKKIFVKYTLPESLDERYCGLLNDTLEQWVTVNNRVRDELKVKAKLLSRSHLSLIVSAILVLILTIAALYGIK